VSTHLNPKTKIWG